MGKRLFECHYLWYNIHMGLLYHGEGMKKKRVQHYDVQSVMYTNVKGGVIAVKEKIGGDGISRFVCECSICSEDKELWPYGQLVQDIRQIRERKTICGCAKTPRYTDSQYEILCKRLFKEYPLRYVGCYRGARYKLYIKATNERNGEAVTFKWAQLHGKGDIKGYYTLKQEDHFSSLLFSDGIEDRKVYCNYNNTRRNFSVCCNRCKESGIGYIHTFDTRLDHIKEGRLPCRCSPRYVYSEAERWDQLHKRCQEIGYTPLKILDMDKRNPKVVYRCRLGHTRESWLKPFLYQNKTCKLCSRDAFNSSGFYPDRAEEVDDTLYLLRLSSSTELFIKIGRSFNLHHRLYDYKRFYECEILGKVRGTHKEIYGMEQTLQANVNKDLYRPEKDIGGKVKECFTPEILNHPEIISTFNLKEKQIDHTSD